MSGNSLGILAFALILWNIKNKLLFTFQLKRLDDKLSKTR